MHPLLCPAQDQFRDLASSPKLHHADAVLQDFLVGKGKTQVIVMLQQPSGFEGYSQLKDRSRRAHVRSTMQSARDKVMRNLDVNHVRVMRSFSYLPAFSAEVSPDGLRQLIALPDVVSVEKDEILKAHDVQGTTLMDASILRGVYNGQGVAIAICDTGIDYTHPMLGGAAFPNTKVIGGYNYGDHNGNPMDSNGHGTSCAGIAAGSLGSTGDYNGGVAYNAKLYALKITAGSSGSANTSAMISAWDWCITHQYDNTQNPILVISTSFGGSGSTSACDTYSSAMTQAAANAVTAGITLFASSGNEGYCDKIDFPACISNVISVGAVFDANIGGVGACVDPSSCAPNKQTYAGCSTNTIAWAYTTAADQVAPYSNTASFLDMFAPSHNAYTTSLGGGYTSTFGGTSASCPYAAGAAACIQSAAKAGTGSFLSPAQVRSKMIAAGDPVTYAAAGITKPRVNLYMIDSDSDSMPDGWEITYFGNLSHTGTVDTDSDGLTDLQEYTYGTNPNNPDTDGDWYTDGAEVRAGTNPLDSNSHPMPVPAADTNALLITMILISLIGLRNVKR
ncbi:MAG TPA: S8 family serine peptidase [Desulfomonilia bacterium]|nr:S8 family serine peptidase [Desulfomonilia bacterium]